MTASFNIRKIFSHRLFWLVAAVILLIFYLRDANKVYMLEKVFPILEKYGVTSYENQGHRKFLRFQDGREATQSNYRESIDTFDGESTAILQEVAQALRLVPVMEIYQISDMDYQDGKIEQAVFSFRNGLLHDGYHYVYDHTPKTFPMLYFDQVVDKKTITAQWSFIRTDWN